MSPAAASGAAPLQLSLGSCCQLPALRPQKPLITALRSGSSGNLYLIQGGATRLLLDCGVNGRQAVAALAEVGVAADELPDFAGILVSHEHSDHIAGLGVLARRYHLPIYIAEKSFRQAERSLGKLQPEQVHFVEAGQALALGDLEIYPFHVPHDAAETLAYTFTDGQHKEAVCTDCGRMQAPILQAMAGAVTVFLEANYEPELLACGPYPERLKSRIRGGHGHLSNQEAGEAAFTLLESGTERFVLSHLSQNNNFPEMARLSFTATLAAHRAEAGRDFRLQVARRYQHTEAGPE